MKLRVGITDDDIEHGGCGTHDCPAARAMERALSKAGYSLRPRVLPVAGTALGEHHGVRLVEAMSWRDVAWIPPEACPEAMAFASAYDLWVEERGKRPSPTSFDIEVPLEASR